MGGRVEKGGEAPLQDALRASVGKYINRGQAGDGDGVKRLLREAGSSAGQILDLLR